MPISRRWLVRSLRALGGLLVLWMIFSFGMEQWALHPRHWSIGPAPSSHSWSYENVSFKDTAGLTLRGWWIPGTNHKTVVMVHGWTSSRQEPMGRSPYLHAAGYNLLVFDLRGHGRSDGNYTTIGWLEPDDVRAAVSYASHRDTGPIALLGYSMGASTVVEEAAKDPRVSAVVEDSGFDTLSNVFGVYFQRMTMLPAVPFDRLVIALGQFDLHFKISAVRPVDAARQLQAPVLAIIGTADTTVPPVEGMDLFHAFAGPKQLLVIPGAGHVGGYATDRALYERTVLAFLRKHLTPA